jgi:hypothetical protein
LYFPIFENLVSTSGRIVAKMETKRNRKKLVTFEKKNNTKNKVITT